MREGRGKPKRKNHFGAICIVEDLASNSSELPSSSHHTMSSGSGHTWGYYPSC